MVGDSVPDHFEFAFSASESRHELRQRRLKGTWLSNNRDFVCGCSYADELQQGFCYPTF